MKNIPNCIERKNESVSAIGITKWDIKNERNHTYVISMGPIYGL